MSSDEGKVRGTNRVFVYSMCACECGDCASMPLCEWVHSLTLCICFCFVKWHTNDRTQLPGLVVYLSESDNQRLGL